MGMVQWSPDTPATQGVMGGYWYPDKIITGFPLTHFSGRGVKYLQDIPIMPTSKAIKSSPGTHWADYSASFSHKNEQALPGYYRVQFDNGMRVELTATPRTGLARIHFPGNASRTVLIRADSRINIVGDDQITGYHTSKIGASSHPYTVYFAAQFNQPFTNCGTWNGDDCKSGQSSATSENCGAWVCFADKSDSAVEMKVGLSFISIENAKANLAAENVGWDFDSMRHKADQAWNALLNRIRVKGGSLEDRRTFYTALYHCFFHPNLLNDANGQYPGMDGKIHTVEPGRNQYQNIPAWDQYRSFAALRALLTPREMSDIVQSLVNYAQQDAEARADGGGLPRWEQVNRNSGGMIGDGDDAIIATSYALGAKIFDTAAALRAMDKGASVVGCTSDGQEVRAGLDEYLSRGYVPRWVSITQEYCVNDFAISQFAGALGDNQKRTEYQNRAQNWKNLFNPATGYIEPREENGAFRKGFKPAMTAGYAEGSAAQYRWLVNFNFRGLFDLMGGNDVAVAQLDKFFVKLNGPMNSANAFMGNEPCEAAPWAYAFAGAPAKTQEVVRRIQNQLFFDRPGGLPGNDDAGALSSWYVFSALGLYPAIPGVGGFVIGSPRFAEADIVLDNGAVIHIQAYNAAPASPYVQSLNLNEKQWNSPWIAWSQLSKGATLYFVLGKSASTWGSAAKDAPPSFDRIDTKK
jgi:predicted alpha-1,2-mannosidase